MRNKVLQGDCLEVMKTMEANSVDTIITDPPYGLGFMGKQWDTFDRNQFGKKGEEGKNDLKVKKNFNILPRYKTDGLYDFTKSWATEALRVLKPGGTALIFAGSRTQHKVACGIEDAGFILKDCIMWLYGCLSEDTEVLTKRGWKHLYKTTKYDSIRIYDITNNIYKWETPERWSIYSVNKDTCYRIKSDTTDQIVSKEHNCLVEREGKFVFKKAWELSKVERVPILSQDFYKMGKGYRTLLFLPLFRKSKGLAQIIFGKRQGKEMSSERIENGKESSVEGRSYLLQKEGKLWQIQDKVCQVSRRIFGYGSQRRLCYGTSFISSTGLRQMFNFKRSNTSQRSQPREQRDGKLNAICKQQRPQITRSKITKIEYTGKMFCPTVSTGAFVARRKGMVFITGNSGFPKATDISKQLDKGHKREVVGYDENSAPDLRDVGRMSKEATGIDKMSFGQCGEIAKRKQVEITEATTPEAKLWNGWKSHGLKPAYEPIIVAMKPNDGTYANNALKHGVSGLNIDGGRIGTEDSLGRKNNVNPYGSERTWSVSKTPPQDNTKNPPKGRFPANIILDEEAGKMLDEQSGGMKSGIAIRNKSGGNTFGGDIKKPVLENLGYGDTGGASRFFYVVKASKKERNMGCEGLEDRQIKHGLHSTSFIGEKEYKTNTIGKNNHPTVKPIALMEYLCILTKTPTGGIVLDPFAGVAQRIGLSKYRQRFYRN